MQAASGAPPAGGERDVPGIMTWRHPPFLADTGVWQTSLSIRQHEKLFYIRPDVLHADPHA